jgi:hypothetical protein
MADANVSRIERGKNTEGGDMGYYRSENYADLKQAMGSKAPYGVFDFKFDHDFLSGVFAKREKDTIKFDSTDEKTTKLTLLAEKFDSEVFGLTNVRIQDVLTRENIVNEQIIPDLFGWYSAQIKRLKQ